MTHTKTRRADIIGTVPFGTPYLQPQDQSVANMQLCLAAVAERFPDFLPHAEPYVNILSFNEWLKRGYMVKKGEKAIRVAGARPIIHKEKDGTEDVIGFVPTTACVFALPQVEPVAKDEDERAAAWQTLLEIPRGDAEGLVMRESMKHDESGRLLATA